MKKGFTLIEMLMILLIIAVLAAFAVPQYETAVDQSRWSTLLLPARSLSHAQDIYFMTKGIYTSDAEQLDIDVSGTVVDDTITTQDAFYTILNDTDQNAVTAQHFKMPNNTLVLYFTNSSNFAGDLHCEAATGDTRANTLCVTLGGTQLGTHNGNTVYLLEGQGYGTL